MNNESLTISQLVEQAHSTAKEKGWWDKPRDFLGLASLIHSEISEAVEEFRECRIHAWEKDGKPEGVVVELADAVIRIADYFGYIGVDLEEVLRMKMEYNKGREYRHGGKSA